MYQLRDRGERLADDLVRRQRVTGQLRIYNCAGVSAHLEDRRGRALLDALHDARVLWLTERAMLVAGERSYLTGHSESAQFVNHRQTWWCVLST